MNMVDIVILCAGIVPIVLVILVLLDWIDTSAKNEKKQEYECLKEIKRKMDKDEA